MKKAAEAFRSIGEVSQLVGVAPHVLRYWETQFPFFSPVKRRDGRRYYRPDDVKMAAGLCELLREEGVSIRGAAKQMKSDRGAALKARGAARLGGDFAKQLVENQDLIKSQEKSEISSKDDPTATAAARKRKSADPASLPLFPELETRASQAASRPVAAGGAAVASEKTSVDWLGRLMHICDDLQHKPELPAAEASALLERMAQTRRRLAA